jgi:hypothetical protein
VRRPSDQMRALALLFLPDSLCLFPAAVRESPRLIHVLCSRICLCFKQRVAMTKSTPHRLRSNTSLHHHVHSGKLCAISQNVIELELSLQFHVADPCAYHVACFACCYSSISSRRLPLALIQSRFGFSDDCIRKPVESLLTSSPKHAMLPRA